MSNLYIVTESHGLSPVGSLYCKYGVYMPGHPILQRIDKNSLAKAVLLIDNTSRLGIRIEGELLYRFTPAGNLLKLLWGVENDS